MMGYVVDFYCPKFKLAIEVVGGIHKRTKKHDDYRKSYLDALGIRMLEFGNEEVVTDGGEVIGEISKYLKGV